MSACDRGLSYEAALEEIVGLSERAHRVKDIGEGFELWRIRRPIGCRFRVQTRVPVGALPQLVTILPDHSDTAFRSP